MIKIEKLIEYRKEIEKIQEKYREEFDVYFEADNALIKASTHLSYAQFEMTKAEEDFVVKAYGKEKEEK